VFWLVSYEKKYIYKRENYLIGGIETLIWNKFIYKIILEWIHVILKQYTQRKILFILSRENNQIPKLNKKNHSNSISHNNNNNNNNNNNSHFPGSTRKSTYIKQMLRPRS
jgi:hypothetical protein